MNAFVRSFLAAAAFFVLLGCTPVSQWNRLYFGMAIPGGGTVGNQAFNQFLRQEIGKRFPKGLTVFEAKGQWQGSQGVVEQENSRVVEIVCDDTPENNDKIAAIAAAYKRLFAQEAVMVIKNRPEIDFR